MAGFPVAVPVAVAVRVCGSSTLVVVATGELALWLAVLRMAESRTERAGDEDPQSGKIPNYQG